MKPKYFCHFTLSWPNEPGRKTEYKCDSFDGTLSKLVKHFRMDGKPLPGDMAIALRRDRVLRAELPNGAFLDVVITDHPVDFATLYPNEAAAEGLVQP